MIGKQLADRIAGVTAPRRIIDHPLFPGKVFVISEKLFEPPDVPHFFEPAEPVDWLAEAWAREGAWQLIGRHYADPASLLRARNLGIKDAVMARARERYRRLKIRSAMSRTKPLPINGAAYHSRSRRRTKRRNR